MRATQSSFNVSSHLSGTTLFAALALLALTGCSVLHPRNPLPAEFAGQAIPEGMENVRDWGDHFSPVLQHSVQTALQLEAEPDNPYGPSRIQYLSLSGGGMNGAFGAGFLCGWTQQGSRPTFDFVTGVSAGALLAPFAFVGTNQDASLRQIYSRLCPEDLYYRKGLLRILRDDSVYDTAPLRKLLEKYITREFLNKVAREHGRGRRLWMGTANLDAKRPVIWDMGAIAASGKPDATNLFINVMMASAAVPGVFPPVYFKVKAGGKTYDELHVDGGIGRQVFAYGPVLKLDEIRKSLPEKHRGRPAELFVIRNGDLATHYDPITPRALPIVLTSITALTHYQAEGDFYRMYVYAQRDKCDYNLTGIPPEYQRRSTKEFDPEEMKRLFDLGERMGRDGRCWVHTPWDELKLPEGKTP
ncbi:MAG: patatin-like phospholipase family protein [Verrucomicrobiota bacterium]